MGCSMGGHCAFLSLLRHRSTFGSAIRLSPAFQAPLIAECFLDAGKLNAGRLYIDNGGDSDEQKVPFFDLLDGQNPGYWWLDTQLQPGIDAVLAALDLHGVDYLYDKIAGARHNERAWGRRIDRPLRYLYGVKNE